MYSKKLNFRKGESSVFFLKLSPFNSTLSDSRPIPSRQTTATPHLPPHQESETYFPFPKTVIL